MDSEGIGPVESGTGRWKRPSLRSVLLVGALLVGGYLVLDGR